MIKKYGKYIDMRNINRDINKMKDMIEGVRKSSEENRTPYNSETRYKCRICNHDDYELYLNIHGYQYCECKNCQSVFLANLPNVKKLYEGIPDTPIGHFLDKEIFKKRVEMIAQPKVDFVADVSREIGFSINQWLDIGCGVGETLCALKTSKGSYSVIGIESDLREISFAREENDLEIIEGYIDYKNRNNEIESAIKNSSVVSFFNVLEHVEEPGEFIDYIYRHMAKGALLVFEVPMHPSLASFANLTANGNIFRHILPPIHLYVFSYKAAGMLLENKFELLATWGFGQGFSDIINNAVINSGIENSDLYNQILNVTNEIQKTIDENNLSDQMLFIARKI
ncbi:MAG: methyltransferase domain-containing protein [Syntrophomonadaceae bacterium]|nr:methyltransferase domain-containing protein [Syntrophomonadaceae bacterium]